MTAVGSSGASAPADPAPDRGAGDEEYVRRRLGSRQGELLDLCSSDLRPAVAHSPADRRFGDQRVIPGERPYQN